MRRKLKESIEYIFGLSTDKNYNKCHCELAESANLALKNGLDMKASFVSEKSNKT